MKVFIRHIVIRYFILPLGIVFVAFFAQHTFAQGNAEPAPEEPRAELEERIEEQRTNTTERRENLQKEEREEFNTQNERRQAALREHVQKRIQNLANNMQRRMEAAIKRLSQIISRVESRIEKLEAQGVDTTRAEEILQNATDQLARANELVEELDEVTSVAVTSESPREKFQNMKRQFTNARNAIHDTHVHLQTIIGLLRQAISKAQNETVSDSDDTSTSTEEIIE